MTFTVIGVDAATKTGLVTIEGPLLEADCAGNLWVVGTTDHLKSTGDDLERASEIAEGVISAVEFYQADLVVFEGYGFTPRQGGSSVVTLVTIGSVTRYFTRQCGVAFIDVPPSALKKFVTGRGDAHKDQMMLAVYKRWGFESPNSDVADAYGLAVLGLAYLCARDCRPLEMTKFQVGVVSVILDCN